MVKALITKSVHSLLPASLHKNCVQCVLQFTL